MERQGLFLFASLFGGAKKTTAVKKISTAKSQSVPMEVITTAAAQPNVLQKKMREKKLTHGETVTASMSPVRLEVGLERMVMFFCPMQTLEVSETHAPGDGEDIPAQVTVDGLKVPSGFDPGLYALKNVKLSSNGTMQITATEKTTWERLPEHLVV